MDQDFLTKTLLRIPWFHDLEPHQVAALARIACLVSLQEGDILFNEGDNEHCLYVILEGEIQVDVHIPGRGHFPMYKADPLDIVGWSVLTPVIRQRTGTARALMTSQLVCLDGKILVQLCEEDHDFGFVIMRRVANVVASRMLSTRLRLFEQINESSEHTPVEHV